MNQAIRWSRSIGFRLGGSALALFAAAMLLIGMNLWLLSGLHGAEEWTARLVEGAVLVELKAARAIDSSHVAQLLNYLRCTVIEIGLILNFGPTPKVRRLIFENPRKHPSIVPIK